MTPSPPRKSERVRWRAWLAGTDHFGWSVAVALVGMLGWLAWGVLTTQVGPLTVPQVALPARETPVNPVAVNATATEPVSPTAISPTPITAALATATLPPTVTPVQATATPTEDTSAVPNGWAAGTVLYVTAETGYHANIFDPPADPTQLQPGDTVTVALARQRRGFYEWVEFEGDRWWFVDRIGWLPEDVLSDTPPG
jgi:hypothetical protein